MIEVKPSIHITLVAFWVIIYIFEAHFVHVCHDILMLGLSRTKWTQSPEMTLAVDWYIKLQLKKTIKQTNNVLSWNRQYM